ncbi:MAG: substrate-binding domain-containing protein [Victivallaceae bacterium]|nr:substrate-binding domain-containing protein [Victivallaceae bacterium]
MKFTLEKASPTPFYLQLAEQIGTFIETENMAEGTPLPNIKEISLRAAVSVETAYKAVNELVKSGKCFRRPKKGTYVGNIAAGNFSCTHTVCAIYCPDGIELLEQNTFNAKLYKGITDQARAEKMDVLLVTGNLENRINSCINSNDIDFKGILTFSGYAIDEISSLAERFPALPIAHLGLYDDDFPELPENIYGIFNDNYSGAYQMTEHFIETGNHKQIAFVLLDMECNNYRDRLEGYKDALKNAKYAICPELIVSHPSSGGSAQRQVMLGMEMAEQLMDTAKPTVIITANDYLAKGVLEYLNSIELGDKIKVAGFDSLFPEISKEQHFSTVKVQYEKIGSTAIKILMNKNLRKRKIIKINPQMIIRN